MINIVLMDFVLPEPMLTDIYDTRWSQQATATYLYYGAIRNYNEVRIYMFSGLFPLCEGNPWELSTPDRWIPHTNDQQRRDLAPF